MAKLENMRGLQVFISKIRNCKNKEEERTVVDKEMGKIRKKFASGNVVTDYDRKKYVWKLLYIYMLGYDVEFGHKQAADLIPTPKYAEKQVGYMACAILLNEKDEFLRLVINSIRNDLTSRNEAFHCLALGFVGSVGGAEMASLLTHDVMNLLTNGAVRTIVRKKAALCLLRLLRKSPQDQEIMVPDVWSVKLAALFDEQDLGVLLALVTLLLGIVARNYEGFESLVPRVVSLLARLIKKDVTPDYHYYGIPSPWLQVKCLRVLQYFPPPEDPVVSKQLNTILKQIVATATDSAAKTNVNKNNAQHAIVFEAVALALAVDADTEILTQAVGLLGKFISVREPNIKYLGLENMVRLAEVPAVNDTISRHQKSIITALKDADVSIRRRAMDLLFTMCSPLNVKEIVGELLNYLEVADFSMREELVLKTAILAERFYPSLEWYVDVSLVLIERAGEFASKEIWHSIVQLITSYPQLHGYAARKVVEALERGASYDTFVCASGYLLGEYGTLLPDVAPTKQFKLLHDRFVAASPDTKALLLTAYMKLAVAHPNDAALKQSVEAVFARYSSFMDVELQQRAVEYAGLEQRPAVAHRNVTAMPPWEKRKSLLLRRFAKREGEEPDEAQAKPSWAQDNDEPAEHGERETITNLPTLAAPTANGTQGPGANDDILSLDDAPPANGHAESAEAAATAPSPATAVGDPMAELMGLSVGGAPAPAAPGTAGVPQNSYPAQAGLPAAYDPFAVSGDPNQLIGGAPQEMRPVGDIQEWYRKLVIGPSGILYEDAFLQLGVKTQYQGPQGQLQLYFGNKSTQTLERLLCNVPPSPQFLFQMAALPPTIEPKKQVQVTLTVTCLAPFLQSPRVQLGYVLNGQACTQNLLLPVTPTKFFTPPAASIPRDAFFTRWRALTGPPLKLSERVSRLTSLAVAPMEQLLAGLNLGVQQGLDPDPDNLVAVGTFAYGSLASPMQVTCMVRIEAEKTRRQQFQVTVASSDNITTSSLKELLCQLLARL